MNLCGGTERNEHRSLGAKLYAGGLKAVGLAENELKMSIVRDFPFLS